MNWRDYRNSAAKMTLPNRSFNKVFGIGYNKTGTTTLAFILKALAFRVPVQCEQEMRIVKQLDLGNFGPLVAFVQQYDAFQDLPFSQDDCYAQVDGLFPNSRFILTTREPESWFKSLCGFHAKAWGVNDVRELSEASFKDRNLYLYENYIYEVTKKIITVARDGRPYADWDLLYDKDFYIDFFRNRNDRIIKYFSNRPDDLLVIDFEKEVDISKILNFFGFSQKLNCPIPHLNKTDEL
jgi:hypothetical protein